MMNTQMKVETTVIPEEDEQETTEQTQTLLNRDASHSNEIRKQPTSEMNESKKKNFKDHLKKRGKSNHSMYKDKGKSEQ